MRLPPETGNRFICAPIGREKVLALYFGLDLNAKWLDYPYLNPFEETVVLSIINHTCGIFLESPGYKNIKYHDPRYEIQKCPKSDVLTLPHEVGVFFFFKIRPYMWYIFGKPCVQATFSNFKQLLGNVDNFWQPVANFSTFCQILAYIEATCYNLQHLLAIFGNLRHLLATLGTFWHL